VPELLDGLNPEQRQACRILDGPLLILAGAGSGKTRTVTHRVAEIIAQGRAQPNQILAVTFTNKAAGEMRQRLQTLIGPDAEAVWCMTFHALCVRILRRSGQALGLATNFAIADSDDQRKIMREILTERVGDGEKVDPSEVRTMLGGISRAKNALQTISQLRSSDQSWQRELAVIWKAYQQALLAAGSVDFDDLLLLAVKALETDHGRAEWARRFTYLHVDEYQDSNAVQTMLLRQLGAASRNICVVGDDDQSVYKWRGAEVEHILHFSRDWPEAKTLKLERNYRSSANIIEAANAVIAENTVRADKQLVPVHEAGSPVRVIECQSGWDEADWVGDEIVRLRRAGANLERVAIIYRTNAQSRVFEERLNTRQIDYHIVGGLEFYRRAEVKTARSYLSLLMNANDRLAFERVIAQPRRGVGQAALASVNRASATSQRSLLQIAVDADQLATISTKARAELIAFGQLYQTLRNRPQSTALVEITRQLLNDSGLLGMYRQQDDEEALANLSELENLIARFTGPWSQALQEFLEHSALVEAGRGRGCR
jgi:DNA helicase-2/ATP-dependent DNA helicase PcrA